MTRAKKLKRLETHEINPRSNIVEYFANRVSRQTSRESAYSNTRSKSNESLRGQATKEFREQLLKNRLKDKVCKKLKVLT